MSRWRSLQVNFGLRFIGVIDRNGCERRILRRRAFSAHLHGSRAATVVTSPHATIFYAELQLLEATRLLANNQRRCGGEDGPGDAASQIKALPGAGRTQSENQSGKQTLGVDCWVLIGVSSGPPFRRGKAVVGFQAPRRLVSPTDTSPLRGTVGGRGRLLSVGTCWRARRRWIKGSGLKLSAFFDGLTERGVAARVRGRSRKVALANVAFPCCCWLMEGWTGELFLPSSHDPPDFSLSVWGHETAKLEVFIPATLTETRAVASPSWRPFRGSFVVILGFPLDHAVGQVVFLSDTDQVTLMASLDLSEPV